MILAGDIGGTKTNLALFSLESCAFSDFRSFPSQHYPSLLALVQEYLVGLNPSHEIHSAAFAVAGPVQNGVCRATNLPWIVHAKEIEAKTKIPQVFLLNDLEANALSLEVLEEGSIVSLLPGKKNVGNKCVVSPGTGLGEAALYYDGTRYHSLATEGGHTDFAPATPLQLDLYTYLQKQFGHVSYERILAGPGFVTLYGFFSKRPLTPEVTPQWVTENALLRKDPLCQNVLSLFVEILGQELGNVALKFLPFGGIYVGGGIAPKIRKELEGPSLKNGFLRKGRFNSLLEEMPVYLILDDKASLKGAWNYARLCSTNRRLTL